MADDRLNVILSMSADIKALERSMRVGKQVTKATTDAMTRDVDGLSKSLGNAGNNVIAFNRTFQQSTRISQHAATNLRAQLQDISVGLASGQSPFTIMSQQIGQVGFALQGLTRGAALRALGSALVSPWTLIPAAIGAASFAASSYFDTVESGTASSNRELADHARALAGLADKYRDIAPEAARVFDELAREREAKAALDDLNTSLAALRTESVGKLTDALANITPVTNDVKRALREAFPAGYGDIIGDIASRFEDLKAQIAAGQDPAEKIGELLRRLDALAIEAPNAGFDRMADTIRGIIPLLSTMAGRQQAILDLQKAIADQAARTRAEMALPPAALGGIGAFGQPGFIGGIRPQAGPDIGTASAAKAFLKTKAASDKIAARMDQLDDEFAAALARLFTLLPSSARIVSGVRTFEEQAAIYASGVRPAARPGSSRHEVGGAVDIGGVAPGVLQLVLQQVRELQSLARIGDPMHVQLAGSVKATAQATDELATSTKAATDAWEGMREVTPGAAADLDRVTEAEERAAEAASQVAQIGQTFFSSFIADLRAGKDASEAFANALSKVVDQLIQMALQSVFSPSNFLGLFGGFPAAPSVGLYRSGGTVSAGHQPRRKVDPGIFRNAPSMARGGMVLPRGVVPILAHAGEMVVPKHMAGRGAPTAVSNHYALEGPVNIDMSDTGLVAADTQAARQFGENVRKIIAVEMVRESRPGGLLRKLPS